MRFVTKSYEAVKDYIKTYMESLTCTYDSFFAGHINNAVYYQIEHEKEVIGALGIFGEEKLLSFFYIKDAFRNLAQAAFKAALEKLKFSEAYALTGDEDMVALCMDFHKSVSIQAYQFDYDCKDTATRLANLPKSCFRAATMEDLYDVMNTELVDNPREQIMKGEVYLCHDNEGRYMGMGLLEAVPYRKGIMEVGMHTAPYYRKQGVGRSIVLFLLEECKKQGKLPIAGCWYYNEASKATLTSCGFIAKTRILRFQF